jgi:Skp family chaperone for outer membrane proteins
VSRPSPSRSSPLAPIREPAPPSNNSNVSGAAAPEPAKPPAKPVVLLLPAFPEASPRQKDAAVVLPLVKPIAQVQQPAASEIKPHGGHGKAVDKEHKPHHQKEEKEDKKDEHKSKDKEKEKDHKEKKDETKKEKEVKDKEKKHHAGEDAKHKEVKAEHGKLHREIKAGVADMVHKASGSGHAAGSGTSVITLAGENKGASMNVGGGKSKNGGEWHGGHGYRLDGGSGSDGKKAAGKPGMMTALINSNVQVINNSLLLQSSCNGGDPGVHLKLSAKSASKEKQKHAPGGDKVAAASAGKK